MRNQACLIPFLPLLLLVLLALSSTPAEAAVAPLVLEAGVGLDTCYLDGISESVLCGTHEVLENPDDADGRRLTLHFAVIPARSRKIEPDPLFLLAGGPGQGALALAPVLDLQFDRVRRHRDIVLVDMRGTGSSNPLDCDLSLADDPSLGLGEDLASSRQRAEECLDGLDADPRFYTTALAIDDLDAIRARLGYETVNLWGSSYGTRAALVYLDRHPERVRSVILDGVAAWDHRYPLHTSRDADRALTLAFERCAADEACAAAYPDLAGRFEALLTQLDARPLDVTIASPATGETMEVTVTRDMVLGVLRGLLYLPEQVALLPRLLDRAIDGDLAPLLTVAETTRRWSVDTMSLGFTLSVLCSEDLPRYSDADASAANHDTVFGDTMTTAWGAWCDAWPRAAVPADWGQPRSHETPALLLSGQLDPVTPPAWGESALAHLPNGRHVVVPGAAHNTSHLGCVPRLLADFLDAGSADDLDAGCVDTIVPVPFLIARQATSSNGGVR